MARIGPGAPPALPDGQPLPVVPRPGAKAPTAAAPTPPPGSAGFDVKDSVTRTAAAVAAALTDKPFASYELPAGEGQEKNAPVGHSEELHQALRVGLGDILGELFKKETVESVAKRAAYLAANPAESAFLPQLGKDFGAKIAQALAETPRAPHPLGAAAGHLSSASNALALQGILNTLLGQSVRPETMHGQYQATLARAGLVPAPAAGTTALPICRNDGSIDIGKLAPAIDRFPAFLEASLEFMIIASTRLLSGSMEKDIDVMSSRLSELKLEKAKVIGELVRKEALVLGLEMASTDETKKALEAQKSQQDFMLGVAIVSCVLAVYTMGMSSAILASSGLSGPGATFMFVGLNLGPICTLASNSPQLLDAASRAARAVGLDDLGAWFEKKSKDDAQWMKDNPAVGYTLMGIEIAFALAQAYAVVDAGSAIDETAQALMTAYDMAQGAATTAVQIASAAETRNLAEINRQVDSLRAQLALVEVEVRQCMHALEQKQQDESNVKDDVKNRQEMQSRVISTMSKAADSLVQLRAAVLAT